MLPNKKRRFLAPGLFLVLFLSCSRTEPRIAYGTLRLVYYQEPSGPVERYSFFIIPEDDDGVEDLDELLLYYDREGLVWSLSSGDWVTFENEDQTWIGSRSIAMVDDGTLPRGQFRAVLVDKGGERSERLFTFDAPERPRFPFPLCAAGEGGYRIESAYPRHYFLCYDNQGGFLESVPVEAAQGALGDLPLPVDTRGIALWADDPEYNTAALTDIIPIR
ncbi:MAG: hypothetical protein LBP32_06155 [Spirochaetaceae bacterium]|jgi:hypothetical protein|nr:hypothetical protein [Spirochaetaceae bacterium]